MKKASRGKINRYNRQSSSISLLIYVPFSTFGTAFERIPVRNNRIQLQDILRFQSLTVEKFQLHIEQCASNESVPYFCRQNIYFKIFFTTLLNLQYRFDFDKEFIDFLSTLEDDLNIELELSFDVIIFFKFKPRSIVMFFNDFYVYFNDIITGYWLHC